MFLVPILEDKHIYDHICKLLDYQSYIYIYRNVCKYVVYISRIRVEHYRYKCMYFINLYISVYVQGDTRKGHIHFKDLFCL